MIKKNKNNNDPKRIIKSAKKVNFAAKSNIFTLQIQRLNNRSPLSSKKSLILR